MVIGNVSYRKTDSGNEVSDRLTEYMAEVDEAIEAVLDRIAEVRKSADKCGDDVFIREALYGIVNEFRDVYRSMGVTIYDGGYAAMEYEGGERLDGGTYDDTPSGIVVDGGDCSQRTPMTATVCTSDMIQDLFKNKEENSDG